MLLDQRQFLVKERAGILKLADTYDIFDPTTQRQIGIAKEEVPGWMKALRLLISKKLMPTTIRVYENEGQPPVLTLRRNVALFRPSVRVADARGNEIGRLQGKFFSLGGGFLIFDNVGQQFGDVKGDWKGWNFQILSAGGRELGVVTKKWAGIGKELFTTADNYMISITEPGHAGLLLAAGLAIDIVFKEKDG
jgi:uncharacterized protein YxjI